MAVSTESSATVGSVAGATRPARILCLGNELVADDGLGILAAHALVERLATAGTPAALVSSVDPAVTVRAFELPQVGPVELVETSLTGMYLLEAIVGASRLIVIDSVVTGSAEPGTVLELGERDLVGPRGSSPHYIGILETLDLARALGLDPPAEVVIIGVEAGDYWTVGGKMTEAVATALPAVVERAMSLVQAGTAGA
jgi:hydrogenase maturation protease